jgi:hypothetical protein
MYKPTFSFLKLENHYLLQINTTEKWCYYHQYNDYSYLIGEDYYEIELPKEFVEFRKNNISIVYSSQEKDQIEFLFFNRGKNHEFTVGTTVFEPEITKYVENWYDA